MAFCGNKNTLIDTPLSITFVKIAIGSGNVIKTFKYENIIFMLVISCNRRNQNIFDYRNASIY